jgi:hypothetical protein
MLGNSALTTRAACKVDFGKNLSDILHTLHFTPGFFPGFMCESALRTQEFGQSRLATAPKELTTLWLLVSAFLLLAQCAGGRPRYKALRSYDSTLVRSAFGVKKSGACCKEKPGGRFPQREEVHFGNPLLDTPFGRCSFSLVSLQAINSAAVGALCSLTAKTVGKQR